METEDYWIYENKIIFRYNYNGDISQYYHIIDKYSEILFTNYDNIYKIINEHNMHYGEFPVKYIMPYCSEFNQPIIISENITRITFGDRFNKIVSIHKNVTHLTFGNNFNQKIIIPQNVTHLTFGNDFNQKIIIPQNVTHLTFGRKFNQQVIIPDNVTHLTFYENFNPLNKISNNITNLIINNNYNKEIKIPENITHLTCKSCYDSSFDQLNKLPINLTHLTIGKYFNPFIVLPNIKYIRLNCNNVNFMEFLPNSVEELVLENEFNLELNNLPNSVKKISFYGNNYDKEINCLPEFIEYIRLNKSYEKQIKKFPLNLKIIECYEKYKYIDDFKDKYNVITY